MSAPEVDSVVSPATFTQVLSPQAGDFVILLRDQSSNPKFRLIDVANVGGSVDFLDNGTLISTRNALNLVGGGFVLTDDAVNEWANLQVGIQLQENNVDLTLRSKLNFLSPNFGEGATITDDAGNDRTNVQIHGTPYLVVDRTSSTLPTVSGTNSGAICLGSFSSALGSSSNCFGTNSDCTGDLSTVVGNNIDLQGTVDESVSIGRDNLLTNTLTSFQFGDNLRAGNSDRILQLGTGNGSFAAEGEGTIQIGWNLPGGSSSRCIVIGDATAGMSTDAVMVGTGSGCINTSTDSVSLGNTAICDGALRSLQIGTGTNTNDDTIQFQTVTLANNVSIEVAGNAGDPNGVVTARIRTLLVDTTSGTDLYINTDGATTWDLISGSGSGTNTYVELTRTTNQTIATGAPGTVVQWENEVYDTDNLVDLGSSATDIVIGTDGEYLIYFEFEWVANSTSFRETSILVNGSPVTIVRDDPPSAGNAQLAGSGLLLNLVATDVITVRVRQDTGGNLDLTGTQLIRLIQLTTSGGGGGAPAYTNSSTSSGVDVTLTPGVSDNRVFISPTVASINCILLTAGADNTTFFTIVNDDPGTGSIDVKIDLAGNPTQVTLDNAAPVINAVFDGTDYKFYS